MNTFYIEAAELIITMLLIFSIIILMVITVRAVRKHRKIYAYILGLCLSITALAGMTWFALSHGTYYKYNDREILGSHITEVQEKYGAFDWNTVQTGRAGTVGYYIYTDDGPVMPDHQPHYYFIHYDENGIVDEVKDSIKPGG